MSRCWIAVASAEHVRRGQALGFMQVCHGKEAPLRRIKPGDWVVYYSPTLTFGGTTKLQAFTVIGIVKCGDPYQVDMGDGFMPYRRDVDWLSANTTPIQPLLSTLEFSSGKRNWGYQFRFGIFAVSEHDRQVIAAAMSVENPEKTIRKTKFA